MADGGDEIALIQFDTECDFRGALDWLRANGFEQYGVAPPPKRQRTATYDYSDADGAALYHVDRFQPTKVSSQWRVIDGHRVYGVKAGVYQRTQPGGAWYALKDKEEPRTFAKGARVPCNHSGAVPVA